MPATPRRSVKIGSAVAPMTTSCLLDTQKSIVEELNQDPVVNWQMSRYARLSQLNITYCAVGKLCVPNRVTCL